MKKILTIIFVMLVLLLALIIIVFSNYKDVNKKIIKKSYIVIKNPALHLKKFNHDYKKYVVFNESIITKNITTFYAKGNIIYTINRSLSLPIIIKDIDKYYVEYKGRLVYVKKEDVAYIESSPNTNQEISEGVSIITYHNFSNNFSHNPDTENIIEFEKQMKYLRDNNFVTLKTNDLELFIDNKIHLPKRSVMINFDDGYNSYKELAYPILKKYNIKATVFLISAWYNKEDFEYAPYVEIASHGNDIHKMLKCPIEKDSMINCANKEVLLDDLITSRNKLNNTNIFCYPYYKYSDYAISVLKEAGFTMAFAGGNTKVTAGINKYAIPRYAIASYYNMDDFIRIVN